MASGFGQVALGAGTGFYGAKTHARPLHPAASAFVSYGVVLVRVRVKTGKSLIDRAQYC